MSNIKEVYIVAVFVGLGLLVQIFRSFFPKRVKEDHNQVYLKDGREYEVHVSDHDIKLVHTVSQETESMNWSDLTDIYAIAIDGFPIGSISWVFHKGSELMEIPWDVKNAETLLNDMQSKLPGFNNEAVIEMSSTLHGYKKIWTKA